VPGGPKSRTPLGASIPAASNAARSTSAARSACARGAVRGLGAVTVSGRRPPAGARRAPCLDQRRGRGLDAAHRGAHPLKCVLLARDGAACARPRRPAVAAAVPHERKQRARCDDRQRAAVAAVAAAAAARAAVALGGGAQGERCHPEDHAPPAEGHGEAGARRHPSAREVAAAE